MITYPIFFIRKTKKFRVILNVKHLNNFTKYYQNEMETISTALGFVSKDLFLKVNLAVFDLLIVLYVFINDCIVFKMIPNIFALSFIFFVCLQPK